jgi:type III pantothenate kinase
MRYKALPSVTGNLPLVKPEFEKEINLIGKSTEESIQSGVQNAVLAEVDAVINQYKDQFEELKIIVTGGDYKYFDKYLKNNIFASPNLVLIGLKKILDFNENK